MQMLFDLQNVKKKEEFKDVEYSVQSKLESVIFKCAMNHPLWLFTATEFSSYKGFSTFEVRSGNGEILGTLKRNYARGEHAITIVNDRIKDKRARGGGYTTSDVDKAVLAVKKMFMPMNILERVLKAKSTTEQELYKSIRNDRDQASSKERFIHQQASDWAKNKGFNIFLDYTHSNNLNLYREIMNAFEINKESQSSHDNKTKMLNGLSNGTSVLIVKDGSNYISYENNKAELYDDENLPDRYKTNLGLLKLIGKDACISGRGYRTDDNTFLVVVGEENELQNSTV